MPNQKDVGLLSNNGMLQGFPGLVTLINSIPAFVAYVDCNMVLQFCNDLFKSLSAINGELIGQKFPLIVGSDIFNQVQYHMGKVLMGKRTHFQILANRKNGLQYFEATLTPHFDRRGDVNGFIFHCTDITGKNKTERALKNFENAPIESDERFRQIATLISLVIWTTDKNGDCIFLSSYWEQLTGKPIKEGLGNEWLNFIHPDDRENVIASWKSCFHSHKPFEGKFRFLSASGSYIIAYANARPICDSEGNVTGYIGILQDISADEKIKYSLEKIVLDKTEDLRKRNAQLREAEKVLQDKNEELEKINKQLSSFAHTASHDLQEPLRKVQINLDRLFSHEGSKFSEQGKNLYSHIIDSVSRMKNLIQDLLTYAQSTEGKLEEVDLNIILKDTISELEAKITEKNATIKVGNLPKLYVVRFQFQQLFLNLLSNALKFSKAGVEPQRLIIILALRTMGLGLTMSSQKKYLKCFIEYTHVPTMKAQALALPYVKK
jgi:PAS domain S-box-containing protein